MRSVGVTIRILAITILLLAAMTSVGCQTSQVAPQRLINHRAMLDFAGLKPAEHFAAVNATGSVPQTWTTTKLKQTALYTDMQWRSPSGNTALGIASINMPLPFSTKVLLWFAQREYARKSQDGVVHGDWVDDLGRHWFEASTTNYRVRGFLVTNGFDGWFVYYGYKTEFPPDANELALGARALETISPDLNAPATPSSAKSVDGRL